MQDLRNQAWQLAGEYHNGQLYGDSLPYLYHLGQVYLNASIIAEQEPGLDLQLLYCCAILHDTLEDTELEAATITATFGPAVTAGVQALTKDASLPDKSTRMADSIARIKTQPREVAIVKLCDRISNLSRQPPSWWTKEKIGKYLEEGGLLAKELGDSCEPAKKLLLKRIKTYREAYC
ncbi:MAG: HD domain-containing protein [Bacteroidota bacterium]